MTMLIVHQCWTSFLNHLLIIVLPKLLQIQPSNMTGDGSSSSLKGILKLPGSGAMSTYNRTRAVSFGNIPAQGTYSSFFKLVLPCHTNIKKQGC